MPPKEEPDICLSLGSLAGPGCSDYGEEDNQTRNLAAEQPEQTGEKQSGNEQTWGKKTGKEQRESCNQKSSEAMLLICYP